MVQAVVPLSAAETYDEFLARVAETYARKKALPPSESWRYGQTFYNLLPAEIADVLCTTHLDPFYYEYVTDECYDKVRRLWERR